eukprot:TRINITY_DN57241_c0_g1_i1.p1 TRINITY_DN57241_c0_g1~~TRINITY_DN57241_c0_g1_i1.p1  ORF type:complete len:112 (+),score=6.67 TRINITY_DN57241_c0_g1_i1:238-573(+)
MDTKEVVVISLQSQLSWMSDFPPVLESNLVCWITISCDMALHMSYTVSAATEAPVRASISTPVLYDVRTVLFQDSPCLLYTSDAADEEDSVDLGGRRIIKKKKTINTGKRV